MRHEMSGVMVRARAAVAAAEELPGRAGVGSSHPSACIRMHEVIGVENGELEGAHNA
jgi:hypothetical protein